MLNTSHLPGSCRGLQLLIIQQRSSGRHGHCLKEVKQNHKKTVPCLIEPGKRKDSYMMLYEGSMYGTWILWEIQTRKAFICFGASRSSQYLGCLYGQLSKLPRWTFAGAFRSQLRVETQAALWNDKKGQQLKRSNVCKGPPRLFLKICCLNMQIFRKPALLNFRLCIRYVAENCRC